MGGVPSDLFEKLEGKGRMRRMSDAGTALWRREGTANHRCHHNLTILWPSGQPHSLVLCPFLHLQYWDKTTGLPYRAVAKENKVGKALERATKMLSMLISAILMIFYDKRNHFCAF